MALTPKQQRFVEEYLTDLNASAAYSRAGYEAKGNAAEVNAARLLRNAQVAAAVTAAQSDRSRRTGVTADRVVEEYAALAFYDPADIGSANIEGPEDIANLPEQVRRAIVGWSWDKAGNFTLKLSPKTPSLDALGKHLGMFREQIDVNIKTDLASRIAERRRRVAERSE